MQNGGDTTGILWLKLSAEYLNQFDTVEKILPGSEFAHKAEFVVKNNQKLEDFEMMKKNQDYENSE